VATGVVDSVDMAASAVFAVLRNAGLVVTEAEPTGSAVAARIRDLLDRIGLLQPVAGSAEPVALLDDVETRLLTMLLSGHTVTLAAESMFTSRRTAERKLARVREKLGAATTAEAVAIFGRTQTGR